MSRGGNIGKENKKKKLRKNVRVTSGKGESRGKFSSLLDLYG